MARHYLFSQSESGIDGDGRMCATAMTCVCWVTRSVEESHQSPKPAFFTVNVPTLDGGEGRRVRVLREGEKNEKVSKQF